MELQNIHSEMRIWPRLQTMTGQTLELEPGESGAVAVPEDVEARAAFFAAVDSDPWLEAADDEMAAALDAAQEAREQAEEPDQPVKGSGGKGKGGKAGRDVSGSAPGEGEPPATGDSEPAEAEAGGKEA